MSDKLRGPVIYLMAARQRVAVEGHHALDSVLELSRMPGLMETKSGEGAQLLHCRGEHADRLQRLVLTSKLLLSRLSHLPRRTLLEVDTSAGCTTRLPIAETGKAFVNSWRMAPGEREELQGSIQTSDGPIAF